MEAAAATTAAAAAEGPGAGAGAGADTTGEGAASDVAAGAPAAAAAAATPAAAATAAAPAPALSSDEVDIDNDEATASVFASYSAEWIERLGVAAKPHPDPLVETTSLAAMSAPRPNFPIGESLGAVCDGRISAPQLETCLLACQRHQSFLPDGRRAGFLLGDGAGVGKGRQLAGIILDSWLRGRRRHIWVSVSADLEADARRDLEEIGAGNGIRVKSLSDMTYDTIDGATNHFKSGVLFITYRCLIGETKNPDKTRLQQIEEWWCSAGRDAKSYDTYDGCLLFDEAHKAKNLANTPPSKTALAVDHLSSSLGGARVVYASATGASEAKHMAYMTRLGLWGEGCGFRTFAEFRRFVEKRGTACMELLASDLKGRGAYLARTLSYAGAKFDTVEVPPSDYISSVADEAADYWLLLLECLQEIVSLARLAPKERQSLNNLYWGSHQRFFIQLVLGLKVPSVVKLAQESLAAGKCVVIGMQSTGEAGMASWLDNSQTDVGVTEGLPSLARMIIEDMLVKLKEVIERLIKDGDEDDQQAAVVLSQRTSGLVFSDSSGSDDEPESDGEDDGQLTSSAKHSVHDDESAEVRKQKALEIYEDLVKRAGVLTLPTNAIDDIIDRLGGVDNVAELSGRTGRMESTIGVAGDAKRQFKFKKRSFKELEDRVNIAERNHFQNGEKLVAVLTDACSTGISLQANRKAVNQKRRVHITIQLPWAAESVIQQFGRTHRSNQSSAPEYKLMVLRMPGEKRMSSGIAKKMEALGALTKGDAKAGAAGAAFGINLHHLGKEALNCMLDLAISGDKSAAQLDREHMLPDCCINSSNRDAALDSFESQLSGALRKMQLLVDPGKIEVNRFLNRIFGLRLTEQELVFGYFEKVHAALQRAEVMSGKKKNTVDLAGKCVLVRREEVKLRGSAACATHLVVERDRGISWTEMMQKFDEAQDTDGIKPSIWKARKEWHGTKRIIYTEQLTNSSQLDVYRPATGKLTGGMSFEDATEKYHQLSGPTSSSSIKRLWDEQYEAAIHICSHGESCKKGDACTHGKRIQEVSILSGNISEAWSRIERQVPHAKLNKVVRAECTDDTRVVGLQMPADTVDPILQALSHRLPTSGSTPKLEPTLQKLKLNDAAAVAIAHLVDFLQSSSVIGIGNNICKQLTPAIVDAINAYALPSDLEGLITYLEGAFQALLEARTEKRIMKAELAQLLKQGLAGSEDGDAADDSSSHAPESPAKVRTKVLSKLLEATRQHAERQQRREEEKKRAQAGLDDDDDDDFAEVKQSPLLKPSPKGSAAAVSSSEKPSGGSKKKVKKTKKVQRKTEVEDGAVAGKQKRAKQSTAAAASADGGGGVAKPAKSAAQMRLNRAAADKTQQKLGFSSLSAVNKDKRRRDGAGADAGPGGAGGAAAAAHKEEQVLSPPTAHLVDEAADMKLQDDSQANDHHVSGIGPVEGEETAGGASGGRKRSSATRGTEELPQPQQSRLKRLRVDMQPGRGPFLRFGDMHLELSVGRNVVCCDGGEEPMLMAKEGAEQMLESSGQFLSVFVSERNQPVLMSSAGTAPKISVVSGTPSSPHEPELLQPYVPIILKNADTIELRTR